MNERTGKAGGEAKIFSTVPKAAIFKPVFEKNRITTTAR
jgi:hypothetical protein